MGKVTRQPQEKHKLSLSPAVSDFVQKIYTAPLAELPPLFKTWGQRWPYPRGDLMNWVLPLDRFDEILQKFIDKYGLDQGPQRTPFESSLLREGSPGYDAAKLQELGYGADGDRELVEAILDFSRLLVEKCANRTIYNSTDRLNSLLNTTSLSLLHRTLRLTIFLAQRYSERMVSSSPAIKFYDYDHGRLRQLARPISYNVPPTKRGPPSPVKAKAKDKPVASRPRRSSAAVNPNDFRALCRDSPTQNGAAKPAPASDRDWASYANVRVTWSPKPTEAIPPSAESRAAGASAPSTPTPLRRHTSSSQSNDPTLPTSGDSVDEASAVNVIEYSPSSLANTTIEKALDQMPKDIPPEKQYELLHKLRVAYGLMASSQSRQDILAIRILAINAIGNVFTDDELSRQLLTQEQGALKPQELIQQLVSLIQDPKKGQQLVRMYMQTLSMETMGVLARHKMFAADINAALGASSTSGLLLRLTQRGLRDISVDDDGTDDLEGDDWREAVFSMPRVVLEASGNHGRSSENVISSSFISEYVKGFEITTGKAMRIHLRMMDFVKTYFHHYKDGLHVLNESTAFEATSNLLRTLVEAAWQLFKAGNGIEQYYKTKLTDYQIPYQHQQIIRSIIDMINDISSHQGANADRVLRSLIDSQALLTAFKLIVDNRGPFGAHTWSELVKAICGFLNNEPTSYTVIAEAGIIKSFLGTIVNGESPASDADGPQHISSVSKQEAPGIPASIDAIANVSQAFEAICLTSTGSEQFQASGALEKFFQIFESPAHVKVMKETNNMRALGQSFDELVRHHPNLRPAVASAVIVMLARVRHIGRAMAFELGAGPKLWLPGGQSGSVCGGKEALLTEVVPPPRADALTQTMRPIKLPNGNVLEISDDIKESESDGTRASITADGTIVQPESSSDEGDKLQTQTKSLWRDDQDEHGLSVSDYIKPAVAFLSTFFLKHSMTATFLDCGAEDIILDFITLPSIPASAYPFGLQGFIDELGNVVHMLAEVKPHLVLPVLTDRIKYACKQLEDFSQCQPHDISCYFEPLIKPTAVDSGSSTIIKTGTHVVRSMTAVYCLSHVLGEVFNAPVYGSRQAQTYLFSQVNIADQFADICRTLGSISAACHREEIALQKSIKETWLKATRPENFSTGDDEVDQILSVWDNSQADNSTSDSANSKPKDPKHDEETLALDRQTAPFKNVKTLRYLLIDTPAAITELLSNLGQGIVGKRRPDTFLKQKITTVANALAEAYINQLQPYFLREGQTQLDKDARYSYLVIALSNVRNSFYDDVHNTGSTDACQSYVVEAFKKAGGVRLLAQIGTDFFNELKQCKVEQSMFSANTGLKICLDTLDELTNTKSIVESPQASVMKNNDTSKAFYFVPQQLLLELRLEALPLTRLIWDSDYADQASRDIVQKLISILSHALTGEAEADAIRTQSSHPALTSHNPRKYSIDPNKLNALKERGYDEELAREALYRSNVSHSSIKSAEEYCEAMIANPRRQHLPVPTNDTDFAATPRETPIVPTPPALNSTTIDLANTSASAIDAALAEVMNNAADGNAMEGVTTSATAATAVPDNASRPSNSGSSAMDLSNILNAPEPAQPEPAKSEPLQVDEHKYSVETIEAERDSIRTELVSRCNNILNSHQNLAFELADLISSAAKKVPTDTAKDIFWTEAADLLTGSLVSMQQEEMTEAHGRKLGAAAHLAALIIQDDEVFELTKKIYQDNFDYFMNFLELPQDSSRKGEQAYPWVPPILLIVERMLARDCEPNDVRFELPRKIEDYSEAELIPVETGWDLEERKKLFDILVKLLPKVGKDKQMALSVARVLVMLTRRREIAALLAEKKNLQKLFLMIKQLAGIGQGRLLSAFMIILRHMLEDEATLKQIMRSEIKSAFTGRNAGRALDIQSYSRDLYHVALRDPDAFVDATRDVLKFSSWQSQAPGPALVLKEDFGDATQQPAPGDHQSEQMQTDDAGPSDQAAVSVETAESRPDLTRQKTSDIKAPVVEHPDGVIHFILSELLVYKDVDDKEVDPTRVPAAEGSDSSEPDNSLVSAANGIVAASDRLDAVTRQLSGGLEATDEVSSEPDSDAANVSNSDKARFKPEDHPIYVYRCFLLSCLVEVLHSYTRTKIELINFSRKSDPQAATPSKPRSGILNYILNGLISSGYVDKDNKSMHCKKKIVTSDWACKVIVALCAKTGEKGISGPAQRYMSSLQIEDNDDEPDLTFVRRFVLEHAIKAFKDATASTESMQMKYSRLLCFSDMFNRLLSKPTTASESAVGAHNTSYKVLGRMMFEKNFVSVLTSSLAEIDLSHPSSRRVIKFILKPLQELTTIATQLSLTSPDLIAPILGNNSDDDISSASSVSEVEDDREETPDLYRNSALGMLDPNRIEDSESEDEEDEDEEMFDEEDYGDEMDYDEEIAGGQEGDEAISDEEEGEHGMPPDGPIEGLPGDVAMDIEFVHGSHMEVDDEEDESDDESDDEDEDEDDDDDGEIMIEGDDGEINADDENDSLGDGQEDEGEWEDEDGEDHEEGDPEDDDQVEGHGIEIDYDGGGLEGEGHVPPGMQNNLNDLLRVLGGQDDDIEIDMNAGHGVHAVPIPLNPIVDAGEGDSPADAGDDDEDDEDDEMDENIDYEDFDNLMDGGDDFLEDQWGFEEPAPRAPRIISRRTAQGRALRGFPPGFLSRRMVGSDGFGTALGGYARMPGRRGARGDDDDGTNPLLQRPSHAAIGPPSMPPGGETIAITHHLRDLGRGLPPELAGFMPMPPHNRFSTVIHSHGEGEQHGAMLDAIVSALHRGDPQLSPGGRGINLSLNGPGFAELRAALQPPPGAFHHRIHHHHHHHHHPTREDVMNYVRFHPSITSARWLEEAKLIFGSQSDKINHIQKRIQSALYPTLIKEEEERRRKADEDQRRQEAEEAARQKAEEEERARLDAEEQDRQAKARLEEEQRQRDAVQAEALAAEMLEAARDNEARGASSEHGDGDTEPMEDVHQSIAEEQPETEEQPSTEAGPSADAEPEQPRVFTTIRGRQLDITGLDIDRDYLEALPEELREEVIMQQYATRREQAQQQTGDVDASGIDPDFLNALPEDIREEIRQQEAHAQRRRERDEARRQQAQTAGQNPPGEMDNDDFFATLDPALRRAILAEQPTEILDQLAPRHAQEGREHARRLFHFGGLPVNPNAGPGRDARNQRDPKRQVVQLIDKAGVATLLRLMFLPQGGSLRANLWHILRNVTGNRQTRFEVINMILVILKEGSTDVTAVERSLASLSLRAKATTAQKTPQPLKRTLSLQPNAGLADEVTPLVVVQQCLSALKQLSQHGFHIRAIFLREVDISANPKSKKGKAKDVKTTKYPVNDLISLLDRKLIMESSSCLQSLAELLAAVTSPLMVLMRKDKEKPEEEKTDAKPDEAVPVDVAVPEQPATIPELPSAPSDAVMTDVAPPAETAPPTEQPAPQQPTGEAQPTENAEEVSTSENQKTNGAEEEQPKKKFEPPVIPESNLKLIVGIFVAQECTGDTFHAALETMQSISMIPETSAVFSKELISHVKRLSESIRSDIDEFLPVVREAQASTDLHGPTSSKFSQSGSDQVKLLQVLKALDYLAAPKKDDTSDESTAKSILTASYEGLSLGPLWNKLSECLNIMSEKDNVIAFATIMLPLIESLMVVCKNTSLKEASLARQATQSQIPTTPSLEDSENVESLFFNFTTEHRKILNDIIRQSPKLMQGTGSFSLLVKNPKVLDFDNKRAFFTKQIHSRLHQQRHVQPPLQLNVRRDQVFQDSYKALYYKTADEMKYGKLNIRFNGEEGVDAGGVTREWFQVLARGIFNPNWALWEPVASDKTTFHPSKLSWVNGEHLFYFKFVGRIIGKALHEGRVLDCHFSRAVYKRMLGKQPALRDLESMDLDYYKSLQWILENDITESIMEDFSVNEEQFGETKVIDLIPDGRNVAVAENNKHDYVQKIVQYRLFDSVKEQMHEFVKGFHDIIPAELIAIFDEQELELLISGLPEIDVDDWKANTEYHNYNANSPQVTWFWRIVKAMSNEERAKLLQFITGTSKVPLNGFKDLEGMQGTTKFSIHRDPSQNRLPTSHTCFNQLDLPAYDNQETLKTSLMTAINLGADYFGFA